MYEIAKTFTFDAAHQLAHLHPSHKCSRLHGHTYAVTLTFRAMSLDERGFVIDYGDLRTFKELIDTRIDHRNLNEVIEPKGTPTTAENLAEWLYEIAECLYNDESPRVILQSVRVSETPATYAIFSPYSIP